MVKLSTNYGDIMIELNAEKVPVTVENFLNYVQQGFYDGLIFHRVIDGFMIQGGGFDEKMQQKPTRNPIKNEANNGSGNTKYSIAMARTSVPDSATAQFFINVADNTFLDHTAPTPSGWGYCVFGKVTAGREVVDKIKAVATTSKAGHQDVPVDAVVIKKASIVEQAVPSSAKTSDKPKETKDKPADKTDATTKAKVSTNTKPTSKAKTVSKAKTTKK